MAQKKKKVEKKPMNPKKEFLLNWGPVIAIVVLSIALLALIIFYDGGASDEYSVTDGSEAGFSMVDENGNPVDVEWEEVTDEEEAELEYDYITTKGTMVQMGDTVDIDFVGTVDGVAFEGGDTEGEGYELTLGSGVFIDGFEDAIVGHSVGETFDVKVTFPDPYESDTSLSGKEAVFKTTINGVYQEAE